MKTPERILVYWLDDQIKEKTGQIERFRTRLRKLAGKTKVDVSTFADPSPFLAKLLSGKIEKPNAIVTDLLMPGIDGVELLRQIRSRSEFDDVALVCSSILGDAIDNLFRKYVGFDLDFSALPYDDEVQAAQVLECVRNAARVRERRYSGAKFDKLVQELYKSRMREKDLEERYIKKLIDPTVFDRLQRGLVAEVKWRRTHASVGFVDIRDFTSISSSLEPEDLALILNQFVGDISKVILEGGGSIDKFIGDAIMWTVGALSADRTHERTNIEIALEIQSKSTEVAAKVVSRLGADIALRCGVGLASGPMDTGLLGMEGPRMQHTVIGSYVNLASRLSSDAGPGEVLIGGRIPDEVKDCYEFKSRGKKRIRGFPHKVLVYSVSRQEGEAK